MRVIRLACLAFLLLLTACAGVPADQPTHDSGYSGTVQKVLRVVRQGAGVPGMKLLGKWESVLAPALRQNSETLRSEEHTSELQSLTNLVCRLLLEKKQQPLP